MHRALLAGFMLSIMVPLIGIVMVSRKTSMVGDALSHCSLTGVGVGLILAFDPTLGAIITCVVAAFGIEKIRAHFPEYGDMATAIVLSAGLGLAAILSSFAPGGNSFDAYLFGSISAVTEADLIRITIVFILVLVCSVVYYGGLLNISIDPNLARLSGVSVKKINFVFTFLSAVTVALATQIVGALLVTSLIVLPVATSLMICRSYRSTLCLSVILGIVYMMLGLVVSYHYDIRPGGSIVLLAVAGMLICWGVKVMIIRYREKVVHKRIRKNLISLILGLSLLIIIMGMHLLSIT